MSFPLVQLFGRDGAGVALTEEVTFNSPVRSYTGRPQVQHLLSGIGRVLEDIEERHHHVSGPRSVIEFTGRAREHHLDGVVVQQVDTNGRLTEVTLTLRPFKALRAATAAMATELEAHPMPEAT